MTFPIPFKRVAVVPEAIKTYYVTYMKGTTITSNPTKHTSPSDFHTKVSLGTNMLAGGRVTHGDILFELLLSLFC